MYAKNGIVYRKTRENLLDGVMLLDDELETKLTA